MHGNLEAFKAHGAKVVAISVDPPDVTKKLAGDLGLAFPVLSDPQLSVIRAYGVEDGEKGIAWPSIFVIDGNGRIAWRSLAETYKVRPVPVLILEALETIHSDPTPRE
ncbi:MAG: peroxiredoxin family protein [Deltaproteobacteria bacterium]|nr:peroxiredoxin family protein [Deltaproteobacteria bacterium]